MTLTSKKIKIMLIYFNKILTSLYKNDLAKIAPKNSVNSYQFMTH